MKKHSLYILLCVELCIFSSGCKNPVDQNITLIISECQNILALKGSGNCMMSDKLRQSLGDPESIVPINQIESYFELRWDRNRTLSLIDKMFESYQAMVPLNDCQTWDTCNNFTSMDVWLYKLTGGPEIETVGGLIPIPKQLGEQSTFWFLINRNTVITCGSIDQPVSNTSAVGK